MPQYKVTVDCPVARTFRVDQACGIFDLKAEKKSRETFAVELPDETEDWQIGVIVGPSGSGKSTVARHAYADRFHEGGFQWPKDKSVLDGFGDEQDVKQITHMLTSVGFSSPPAWLRPYHVLSGGQRFRCDLARALLTDAPLVAFDEFTSVVDRNVAKIGSAAVAKSIRKGRIGKKFVAVTCHYDILDWLEPDWVLDMATCQLARGCLQAGQHKRPPIDLTVHQVQRSAWEIFRKHHYLNMGPVANAAKCFCAFWHDEPVAFTAWVPMISRNRRRGDKRAHRTVVLPDYQGVGIGNRLGEFVASMIVGAGGRAFSTTSHPAMIRYRNASPLWKINRLGRVAPMGGSSQLRYGGAKSMRSLCSIERITAGCEYVGPGRIVD